MSRELENELRAELGSHIPTRESFDKAISRSYEAGKEAAKEDYSQLESELKSLSKKELRKRIKALRHKSSSERKAEAEVVKKLCHLRGLLSAHDSLGEMVSNVMKLERAPCSALHRLRQSIQSGAFFIGSRTTNELSADRKREYDDLFSETQAFVVQHDWAEAFKNAGDYDGVAKFKLPYEACAFEFKVSGHHVVILATEADGIVYIQVAAEVGDAWFSFERAEPFYEGFSDKYSNGEPNPIGALIIFLRPQIKAVCVALDAEVAETEVVRAPHKLNQARAKAGKPPVADYHVVSLASRERAKSFPGARQTGVRRRLHFRRGHWRHFESFKTWVRWTLVGDPDLGFVDKEYRI